MRITDALDRAATCRATGNHRTAQNDEPEWDRGPLTMPAELTEADFFAAVGAVQDELEALRRDGIL